MAKSKYKDSSSVLTANALQSGDVVFWNGTDWVASFDQALLTRDSAQNQALEEIARQAEAEDRVVGAYLVALDSARQPIELRERIRLSGALATTQPNRVTEKLKAA